MKRRYLYHLTFILFILFIVLTGIPLAAIALFAAARLGYVAFTAWSLRAEETRDYFTHRYGAAEGFQLFKRTVWSLMIYDGVAFVLLCWVTRDTLPPYLRTSTIEVLGFVLLLLGVAIKTWSAQVLGKAGYFWIDFFFPGNISNTNEGPYRVFKNPMYTVGNLSLYGLALFLGSREGLIASVLAQVLLMAMYHFVEEPHFKRMLSQKAEAAS